MRVSLSKKYAFLLLAMLCMLNANGLGYMLLGLNQLGSVLILFSVVVLLNNPQRPKYCLSTSGMLFLGSIAFYLFMGTIYTVINHAEQLEKYLTTYGSSLLVVYATANYVGELRTRDQQLAGLEFVAWSAFLGVCSVFFSDYLFQVYANPPASLDRSSGFFANANEAGITSLISFSLMLWLHHERMHFKYLAAALVSIGAVFLTFSKSSITGLFIILFIYLVGRRKIGGFILVSVFAAVASLILSSPDLFFDDLLESQAKRIDQVFKILMGEIDSDVTTGRTILWEKGLSMAAENSLIFGSGLGSFHSFKGMSFDYGDEIGVHNTYFMILGEAGLPVVMAFVIANLVTFWSLYRARSLYLFMYFVVLQIDLLSAHNILGLRFHNLMMGFVFGALACHYRRVREVKHGNTGAKTTGVQIIGAGCLPFAK